MRQDKEKWDRRYTAETRRTPDADPLLIEKRNLLSSGFALDLASGLGGNALYLAGCGYSVLAVDISFGALSILRKEARTRGLEVQCVATDLDYFALPAAAFDLVTVFYFFDEALISRIRDCLKVNGLLFYATFNHRHLSLKPEFNPDYLVDAAEFPQLFNDFDLLYRESEAGHSGNISQVICRKSP